MHLETGMGQCGLLSCLLVSVFAALLVCVLTGCMLCLVVLSWFVAAGGSLLALSLVVLVVLACRQRFFFGGVGFLCDI